MTGDDGPTTAETVGTLVALGAMLGGGGLALYGLYSPAGDPTSVRSTAGVVAFGLGIVGLSLARLDLRRQASTVVVFLVFGTGSCLYATHYLVGPELASYLVIGSWWVGGLAGRFAGE